MPVDPQVQLLLDQLQAAGMPALFDMEPAAARAMMEQMRPPTPPEAVAAVEDRVVPGPPADVPIRIYRPSLDTPLPVVVYFHGGGWVIGSIESHDLFCRQLANRSGCIIVSVEYRLGPEHRFPAAVEDAQAATAWVAAHARELRGDPDSIAVGGDSAGGNLAAVVALLARDQGGPRLAYQLLVYPATDMRSDHWPSFTENGQGYFLGLREMAWFTGHYLSSDAERDDVRASPAFAASHAGLPPALIVTAEYDPLRDQGEAYGEKLRAAGVPVRVRRYDGMIHGFATFIGLDAQEQVLREIAAELRAAFKTEAAAAG